MIGTQRWQYIHFKILRSNYTLNYFVGMISYENLTNRKYTYVLGTPEVFINGRGSSDKVDRHQMLRYQNIINT